MSAIKDIKNLRELKGANTIRGKFYIVGNKDSNDEFTLGYTEEGTFSIEREYRDSNQNQTVSGVKGLVHLDSAKVSFETTTLQLDDNVFSKMKGFEKGVVVDLDGTSYDSYREPSFVKWGKYIPTIDLLFEYSDGKVGAIRMFNVLEKSAETIVFSRTDDSTIAIRFEAHISESDDDSLLPYEFLIEQESDEKVLERAAGEISKLPIYTTESATELEIQTEIAEKVLLELGKLSSDYENIIIDSPEAIDVSELVSKPVGTFVKGIEINLSLGIVLKLTDIGVTVAYPTP